MNDGLYQKAVELRHELHRHPELSNEETETKQRLMDFLRQNAAGIEITDCGKWFYAAYRSENPNARTVAFRTEIDALPVEDEIDVPWRSQIAGVGHKCGHDGHAAALAAFASEVSLRGADNHVYFVFQHAEEIGGGGAECAALMEQAHVDEVFSVHNSSDFEKELVVVKPGTSKCASEGLEIIFTGVPAHASQPEKGKNPAMAVCNIVAELPRMADPARYRGLVLCTVIQMDVGERAFGCSAADGRLLLTLRGQYEDEMNALKQEIVDMARKQGEDYGLEIAFAHHDVFPETKSWPQSTKRVEEACAAAGLRFYERPDFQRASEDFGYFTKRTPGAYIWLGNGTDYPAIHTSKFDFIDTHIRLICRLYGALAGIRQ